MNGVGGRGRKAAGLVVTGRDAMDSDVTNLDDAALAELLEQAKRTNADLPEPALPPVTTCEVDGITVHHLDSGAAGDDADRAPGRARPTFVLVHGLGDSFAGGEPPWGFLTPPHERVLAPDLAGFGRTQAAVAATSVGANAALLASYLRLLGVGPIVLVGNSMGGMIAAMLTASPPISSSVSCSSTPCCRCDTGTSPPSSPCIGAARWRASS